jgi:hypothetical protein
MKRVVLVLAFLGILGLGAGTVLAHDYGGWGGGWGRPGHRVPYYRGYYGYYGSPRVVVRPPVVVAPPPVYTPYSVYGPWGYPWGYNPYDHGSVRFYGRGFGVSIRF